MKGNVVLIETCPSTGETLRIETVLAALSDPMRLEIVRMLSRTEDELCCGSFGEALCIPKSTLAHHLKVLRASGIVATRSAGTHGLNTLRRDDLDARFPGLLDAILAAK